MDDKEFLKEHRQDLEESVDFFSSAMKKERELWVVRQFLLNLNIPFNDSEIKPCDDDPPDVYFGEAAFEVKEVLDPGRRRHREYKLELEKARKAKDPSELFEQFTAMQLSLSQLYEILLAEATSLGQKKYPSRTRRSLDLLFYVNLEDVMALIEDALPDVASLDLLGWRSVSFLMWEERSCVLSVSETAPQFLVKVVGRVIQRRHEFE